MKSLIYNNLSVSEVKFFNWLIDYDKCLAPSTPTEFSLYINNKKEYFKLILRDDKLFNS